MDLNLGCPQRHAREHGYGAYLLARRTWSLVHQMVAALSGGLSVPVCCKMRLLDSPEESVAFARLLEDAGCALLAVHGRTCDPLTGHKRRRTGPADLEHVAQVVAAVHIPVLTNGNVCARADVVRAAKATKASGLMSACGILVSRKR